MSINVTFKHYKGLALDNGTHFFGTPCLTKKLANAEFEKEEMFIGQLNMADLATCDELKVFPTKGMLYFFYDMFQHKYSVYFDKNDGETLKEDCNSHFEFGRFSSPLSLTFSVPTSVEEKTEYCAKLICDVPQMVKDEFPKYAEGYKCLLLVCPKDLDYFDKQYLIKVNNYSCVIISEKDLKAKKFSKIFTANV